MDESSADLENSGRRKSSNAAKSEDVDFVRSRRDQGYVESEGDRVGG